MFKDFHRLHLGNFTLKKFLAIKNNECKVDFVVFGRFVVRHSGKHIARS